MRSGTIRSWYSELGARVSACAITRGRNGTHEEWVDKGIREYDKLIPIEGGDRVESQTVHATRNRGELCVLRGYPSHPVEVRHRLEDVAREPEVDEHRGETVHEPPHPGNRPAVDYVVGFGMKGAVEGDGCQVCGPDSLGRVYEESTR